MALTPKKLRFCEEYPIDLNGTKSAIRAGFSERTARSAAARLLSDVNVQDQIAIVMAKMSKRTEVTQDRVVAELAKLGFYDIRKAVRWGGIPDVTPEGEHIYPVEMIPSEDLDDDTAAAISEVSLTAQGVKIKMSDKLAALEKLGKHLGMFTGETGGGDDAIADALNNIAGKLPG